MPNCCRARFRSVLSKLYSLTKFLLGICVGITFKTMYDPPVKCFCPTVYVERETRSFEQEILESNIRLQLREPFKPTDASEIIPYEFFNASVVAGDRRSGQFSSLQHIDKLDIAELVSQITALLGLSGHGDHRRLTRLENGYRRLDLVRGMEYVVDAGVSLSKNNSTEFRKLHLVRPFGVMHLLSNVAFDDAKLVHFVVAVPGLTSKLHRFLANFESVFADGNDQAYLLIVICSNSTSELEAVRSAANAVQHRRRERMHVRLVQTRRRFDLALALDLGSRQLPGSALIVFMDVEVQFSRAALRRCRLHAVEHRQVYYPVVFAQYDPDIVRRFSPAGTADNPEISQHAGQLQALPPLQGGYVLAYIYRSVCYQENSKCR